MMKQEMKHTAIISTRAIIGTCVLACGAFTASPARADYEGLTVELHNSVSINGTLHDVFRVYANFSNVNDRLVIGFGGSPPEYVPVLIETRNANDTGAGNAFFSLGGVVSAPTLAQISSNAAAQWASFVTIGTPIADFVSGGDQTQLTPGFAGISGTTWTHNNQAWFVSPTDGNNQPPIQSVAGWTGDGDSLARVMLMQLTVRAGENVRGVINLGWFPPIGQGGAQFVINEPLQSFNSFTIPTPGTMAALAVAMIGTRFGRRRAL